MEVQDLAAFATPEFTGMPKAQPRAPPPRGAMYSMYPATTILRVRKYMRHSKVECDLLDADGVVLCTALVQGGAFDILMRLDR